jgi:hypothetical protein
MVIAASSWSWKEGKWLLVFFFLLEWWWCCENFVRMMIDLSTSWARNIDDEGGVQYHGWSSFSRDSQVNTCFERWRHDDQVVVRAIAQVGNFVSMVTSGEWWKIKKRYLSSSLDNGNRSRKGKKAWKGIFDET